jgi:hypothetical protein
MHNAQSPFARILIMLGININAMIMPMAMHKLPLINKGILPSLNPISFLFISLPLPLIPPNPPFYISSLPMPFIIFKLALIDVTIFKKQYSFVITFLGLNLADVNFLSGEFVDG